MRIACPVCGERDYTEFRYGGDASKVRPAHGTADMKAWYEYVFVFGNPKGLHREYWQHVMGAGSGSSSSAIPRPMRFPGDRGRRDAWAASDYSQAAASIAARPLAFTFDGRRMHGFRGDTLASALLANGVKLIGRSFKYHRPRGFLAAGVEEPNGLFTLGEGRPDGAKCSGD